VEQATRLASELLAAYDAAIIASLADQKIWQVVEPTVGIVLAAGGSTRFGQPKMLLPWRGKPLIRWVVQAGLEAGLAEVIVVTGAVNAPLHAALADLPVHYVENPRWHEGQSTSVRAGLAELPGNISGAVFLLADQPFVRADLIRELVRVHRETLAPVIAPEVGSRRANPVLFDRVTFPALLALEGDTGGRAVFDRFPPRPLPWEDAAILGDIDTPEDYDRLIQDEA
jgi:molybdenum cofactor cytidylyltransferase